MLRPAGSGVHRRETDCTQQKGPEDASLGALLVCRVPPTVMGLGYSPSVRKPLCVSGDQQVAGRSPGVVRSDSRHDPPERSMCLPLSPRCVTLPGDRDSVVCVLHFRQLWRYCGASHRSVRNEPPRSGCYQAGGLTALRDHCGGHARSVTDGGGDRCASTARVSLTVTHAATTQGRRRAWRTA